MHIASKQFKRHKSTFNLQVQINVMQIYSSQVPSSKESNPLKEPLLINPFMNFALYNHSGTVWFVITQSFVQTGFILFFADRFGGGVGGVAVMEAEHYHHGHHD